MPKRRSWTEEDLRLAVRMSLSKRQVLARLGLIEAGGNYDQLRKYLREYNIDTSHFTGKLWSKGKKLPWKPVHELKDLLVIESKYQSNHLRVRLIREGLKKECCEECGWDKKSDDGRIPVELDHINGDRYDNRLENLRIFCPNCHSLKPTHRGLNKSKQKSYGPVA